MPIEPVGIGQAPLAHKGQHRPIQPAGLIPQQPALGQLVIPFPQDRFSCGAVVLAIDPGVAIGIFEPVQMVLEGPIVLDQKRMGELVDRLVCGLVCEVP